MVTFSYAEGGSIDISYKLDTVRVELYATPLDKFRLFLEIMVTVACMFNLLSELWELFTIWRKTGSVAGYFGSPWNWIDLASIGLMWAGICMWWIFVLRQASTFDIGLRYEVYDSLTTPAAMLRLAGNGEYRGQGMREVQAAFAELQRTVDSLVWYYSISGVNIILLIARLLKQMDFQPRLGVVTHSLALAGPDLAHFILVAGMVFCGYAMMAHLIFGNNIEGFRSFGSSLDTCFEILLGEIGVNSELRVLTGLQGIAGTLFFWSFELLVYLVLLNFLLAIIVDAFSEIKENTSEHISVHTEIGQMVVEKWRSVTSCFSRRRHITDARLGQILQTWGADGSEASSEHEPKKHITVMNTMLYEEDLAAVLKEALKDMKESELANVEVGKKNKPRLMSLGVGIARRTTLPTEEELETAAQCIVSRFGNDSVRDEPEENEDEEVGDDEAKGTVRLHSEKELERQRDALATALDKLSSIQRQLSDGQARMVAGQQHIARQHDLLARLLEAKSNLSLGAH